MQLAIEEMNKSVNESRPDGKIPPKVGAVLLFPNGDVKRAHRGELREGDHAEYTLIERKLPHERLNDCILFTTLEPCVQRNKPKIACCKRTTNARIKTVYVGIIDPDPTVSSKGIAHLEQSGVSVIMFDRDLQKQIEKENEGFLKQAIERRRGVQEEVVLPSMEKPNSQISFDDFSVEALQKFIVESKLAFKIEQPEFKKYLTDFGVLAVDKKTGELRPTGFGILLFGFNPRVIFKQAVLKCSVDYGDKNIETKDFSQPLVLVPDLVEEWIRKVLPVIKNTSSFKRKDIPVFPIEVLREAVINALVHRDYSIEGAKSYFQITSDKIEIKSPGAPVRSISIEQLNTFKAPSISRNPIIAYAFNLMGYVEETGFGMDALRSLQQQYDLPLPEYTYEEPYLTLTFARTLEAVKRVSQHEGVAELSDDELKGYEWIKSQDEISARDYAQHFEYTQRTANRHLSTMLKLGLIKNNEETQKSPKLRYSVK